MNEEKINQIIKALSIPVIVLAFLPLWIVVSSMNVNIVPEPKILIGAIYAAALTLSVIYFGLRLREICK